MESPTVTGAPAGSRGRRPHSLGEEGRAQPAPPSPGVQGHGAEGPPCRPVLRGKEGAQVGSMGGRPGKWRNSGQGWAIYCPQCVCVLCVCLGTPWGAGAVREDMGQLRPPRPPAGPFTVGQRGVDTLGPEGRDVRRSAQRPQGVQQVQGPGAPPARAAPTQWLGRGGRGMEEGRWASGSEHFTVLRRKGRRKGGGGLGGVRSGRESRSPCEPRPSPRTRTPSSGSSSPQYTAQIPSV